MFDARGDALASARVDVADHRPRPGWVEQDPEAVVASLRDAADAALAQLDDRARGRVSACGLACQRSSLACWDRATGRALSPILSWQDTRAADWLAAQALDVDAIRASTGLVPNAHFGLSKMRWCLDHLDAVRDAAADDRLLIGPLAAFLAFRLLDQQPCVVDPANASRTLLLDLARGDWNGATLARLGIARRRGACRCACSAATSRPRRSPTASRAPTRRTSTWARARSCTGWRRPRRRRRGCCAA